MSTAIDPGELKAEEARPSGLVAGWISVPDEECYAAATLTFNAALERRPVLAVSCRTVEDAQRAVEAAGRLRSRRGVIAQDVGRVLRPLDSLEPRPAVGAEIVCARPRYLPSRSPVPGFSPIQQIGGPQPVVRSQRHRYRRPGE